MHINSFCLAHSEPTHGLIILCTHLFQQPATQLDLTETQITSRQKLTSFYIAQNLSFKSRQVLKIVIILLESALTISQKCLQTKEFLTEALNRPGLLSLKEIVTEKSNKPGFLSLKDKTRQSVITEIAATMTLKQDQQTDR